MRSPPESIANQTTRSTKLQPAEMHLLGCKRWKISGLREKFNPKNLFDSFNLIQNIRTGQIAELRQFCNTG